MFDRTASGAAIELQAISRLRELATRNSPQALRAAAQQFESLFVQMMLKSMRSASLTEGIFDSEFTRLYRDLFDQNLSAQLSERNGIGLADVIVKQLGPDGAGSSLSPPDTRIISGSAESRRYLGAASALSARAPVERTADEIASAGAQSGTDYDSRTDLLTPSEFVQALWPQAQQAARSLGISPRVLLAQAALETGWGRGVPRHPDGRSSHNLFGIKADSNWQGERLTLPTLEYLGELPVRTQAAFRSYRSYAESFDDYIGFLRSNPRYTQALTLVHDLDGFVHALQAAGYATDPLYARKILEILKGETLTQALVDLKPIPAQPIS